LLYTGDDPMSKCPVDFTCPDIDQVIKTCRSVAWHIRHSSAAVIEEQAYRLQRLCEGDGPLERLRNSNRDLRNWGYANRFNSDNTNNNIDIAANI